MRQILAICFALFTSITLSAQNINGLLFDATNTATRDGSAAFEINANTGGGLKGGFLMPRVALTGSGDVTTIAGTEATGLVVYNDGTGGLSPAGFYYWTGGTWMQLATATGGTGYIQNQSTAVQNPGTFWIQGVGRVGDGTAALPGLSFNSGNNTGIYYNTGSLGLSTAGSERMRVASTGQVSINTTSVPGTFNVNGTQVIGAGLTSRAAIGSTISASDAFAYAANSDAGDGHRMFSVVNENATANNMAILSMRVNPAGVANNQMLDMKLVNPNDGTSKLIYSFGPNATFTDRFTFASNGNLGIGTTSPLAQLHTTGTVRFGNYPSGMLGTDASGTLQTRTITGTTNQLDVTNGNGVAGNPTLNINSSYTADLKANRNMTGGGTVSFISNVLKWTARFIVISNGNGTHFSTSGYFDMDMPTSGTITGVGGAANATATASGIPLTSWQALYYILPIGSGNGSVAANYRIAYFTSALTVPETWTLVAVVNGDDGSVRLGSGVTIAPGGIYVPASGYVNNQAVNATFATGQAASFDITGNGEINGTLNVNGNVGVGTLTASDKLHVNGSIRSETGVYNSGGDHIEFMSGVRADDVSYEWQGFYSGTTRQGIILYDGAWTGANNVTNEFSITAEGSNMLTLNTSGNSHLALMPKGTGNVGIGTLAPINKLQVLGDARIGVVNPIGVGSQPSAGNRLYFSGAGAAAASWDGDNSDLLYMERYNSGSNTTDFRIVVGDDDGAASDRLTIGTTGNLTKFIFQMDGNLGIATTAPTTKLHVNSGALRVGSGSTDPGATDGVISLGNTGVNYNPTTGNWTSSGTTLLLSASDYSTIGFHDSGNRVDFIRTGVGTMQIGYDGGWGAATVQIPKLAGTGNRMVYADASGNLKAGSKNIGYIEDRGLRGYSNANVGYVTISGATSALAVETGDIVSINTTLKFCFQGGSGGDDVIFRVSISGCASTTISDYYYFEDFDNNRNELEPVAVNYVYVSPCNGNLQFTMQMDHNSAADDAAYTGDVVIVATKY